MNLYLAKLIDNECCEFFCEMFDITSKQEDLYNLYLTIGKCESRKFANAYVFTIDAIYYGNTNLRAIAMNYNTYNNKNTIIGQTYEKLLKFSKDFNC